MPVTNPNLVDLTNNSEKAREMGRKGGLSRSKKKSISARLRWLRERGLSEENCSHLASLIDDPDYTSLDILTTLQKMKSKANTIPELNMFANAMLNWQKTTHGSADSTKVQINTQNNFNMSEEDKKDIALRLLGKKE